MKSEQLTNHLTQSLPEKSFHSNQNTKEEPLSSEELRLLKLRVQHRRQTAYNKLNNIHGMSTERREELQEELGQLDKQWEGLKGKEAGDE